jgi:ABC-2 type transport system permease protein
VRDDLKRLSTTYVALVRAGVRELEHYRASVVIGLITTVFPLTMLAAWLSILGHGSIGGMGRNDFIVYYVALIVLREVCGTWITVAWDREFRSGHLSAKLLLPLHPVHHLLARQLARNGSIAVALLPAYAIAATFWPVLSVPASGWRFCAIACAVLLAAALNTFMALTIAMLSFWSTKTTGFYQLWVGAGLFLSGWVAPTQLLGRNLHWLAGVLPFRYTLGFPASLLSSSGGDGGALYGLAVAIVWTLVFAAGYAILWRSGIKRYEALGA